MFVPQFGLRRFVTINLKLALKNMETSANF